MIIAFTGGMGVGKTTAAKLIKQANDTGVILKFAQPLYDMQKYIYNRVGMQEPPEKDRKLLQLLGTDWGRQTLNPSIWVDLWNEEALKYVADDWTVITDDCRFDNEAVRVRALGGIVVKIVSPRALDRITTATGVEGHASERSISPEYVDFTLNNDSTLLDFENSVVDVYDEIVKRSVNSSNKRNKYYGF